MKPNRPYLLRAFYEWIVDSDCTPYIAIDAYYKGVQVPQQFVTDGQIVLNISPRAVSKFEMGDDHLQLLTKFGGIPMDIYVPLGAIIGIYAHENGQGMVFELEEPQDDPPPTPPRGPKAVPSGKTGNMSTQKSSKTKQKASLRVVK